MNFTAVGFSPLPDIDTARRNHGLSDLSDEDVGKVVFHRHKQSGNGEELGWDQLVFGTLSLLRLGEHDARIETLSLQDVAEADLIDSVFRALDDAAPLVTWKPGFVHLLQFRCMKLRRSAEDYWGRVSDGNPPHLDLQAELGIDRSGLAEPSLEDMAQRLFLPGMQGMRGGDLWDQWLEAEYQKVATFADYEAINTALLALEIFHLKGRLTLDDILRRREFLFELITSPPLQHRFSGLATNWKPGL